MVIDLRFLLILASSDPLVLGFSFDLVLGILFELFQNKLPTKVDPSSYKILILKTKCILCPFVKRIKTKVMSQCCDAIDLNRPERDVSNAYQ